MHISLLMAATVTIATSVTAGVTDTEAVTVFTHYPLYYILYSLYSQVSICSTACMNSDSDHTYIRLRVCIIKK